MEPTPSSICFFEHPFDCKACTKEKGEMTEAVAIQMKTIEDFITDFCHDGYVVSGVSEKYMTEFVGMLTGNIIRAEAHRAKKVADGLLEEGRDFDALQDFLERFNNPQAHGS